MVSGGEPGFEFRVAEDPRQSSLRQDGLFLAILTAGIVVLFILHFGRFGDLVVDSGRDAEYGTRVLGGEIPYRDFDYDYGPLIPYLIAGLYRIFGIHLNTIYGLGLAITLISMILYYYAARAQLGAPAAFFVTAVFVTVFQFSYFGSYSIFNFIFPYTFTATVGFTLLLAQFHAVRRIMATGSRIASAVYGAAFGLACTTKIEIAASSAVFLFTVIFFSCMRRRSEWITAPSAVIFTLSLAAGSGISLAPILLHFDILGILDIPWLSTAGGLPYLLLVSGVGGLFQRLSELVKSVSVIALFGVVGIAGDIVFRELNIGKSRASRAMGARLAGTAFAFTISVLVCKTYLDPIAIFRGAGIGVLLFACVQHLSARIPVSPRQVNESIVLGAGAITAFALSMRAPLALGAPHYGFYVTPLAFLFSSILVLRSIPDWLDARFGGNNGYRWYRAFIMILFTVIVMIHLHRSYGNYALRDRTFRSDRAVFRLSKDQARELSILSDYMSTLSPDDRSLFVLPEGMMVNFILSAPSRSYHSLILPHVSGRHGQEAGFLDELEQKGIHHVAVVTRWSGEYGASVFGEDYFQLGFRELQSRFSLVIAPDSPVYSPDGRFRIALYRNLATLPYADTSSR